MSYDDEFLRDKAKANSKSIQDWWNRIYEKAFPKSTIENVIRLDWQRLGIDKVIKTNDGQRILVDEKIRPKRKPIDILLEHTTIYPGGKTDPSWMEKEHSETDYLAVGFKDYNVAFFFHFPTLRILWYGHADEWKRKFRKVEKRQPTNPAKGEKFRAISCCVPTDLLMRELGAEAVEIKL